MHFTDNTRRAGSAPLLRGGGSRAEWFAFRRLPKKRAAARFTAARFPAARFPAAWGSFTSAPQNRPHW